MIDFIKNHAIELATFVAGASAWGYERNKRNLEIKKSETDNLQAIMDLYQEALDDLKKRYDDKFAEIKLDMEILRNKLETEQFKYALLKKEFEAYKFKNK
jgi:hypothetical protein